MWGDPVQERRLYSLFNAPSDLSRQDFAWMLADSAAVPLFSPKIIHFTCEGPALGIRSYYKESGILSLFHYTFYLFAPEVLTLPVVSLVFNNVIAIVIRVNHSHV